MTTILLVLKYIGSLLSKIPAVVWIVLAIMTAEYFAINYYRDVKQERINAEMIAHADTTQVPHIVIPPKPPEPKPIAGKPLPIPIEILNELQSLRESNIDKDIKLAKYDSLLTERSTPYQTDYEDSVQVLVVFSEPANRTATPFPFYKPQLIQVPQLTISLPPKEIMWYQSKTVKVLGGAIGAYLIYRGADSKEPQRMYYYIGGVGILGISFAL
jgi:hypothetical protein